MTGVQTCALPISDVAGYIEVDGGRIWYRLNGAEHLDKRPAIIVAHEIGRASCRERV